MDARLDCKLLAADVPRDMSWPQRVRLNSFWICVRSRQLTHARPTEAIALCRLVRTRPMARSDGRSSSSLWQAKRTTVINGKNQGNVTHCSFSSPFLKITSSVTKQVFRHELYEGLYFRRQVPTRRPQNAELADNLNVLVKNRHEPFIRDLPADGEQRQQARPSPSSAMLICDSSCSAASISKKRIGSVQGT